MEGEHTSPPSGSAPSSDPGSSDGQRRPVAGPSRPPSTSPRGVGTTKSAAEHPRKAPSSSAQDFDRGVIDLLRSSKTFDVVFPLATRQGSEQSLSGGASSTQNAQPPPKKVVLPFAEDEKCWMRSKQTNFRRSRGLPPLCKLVCWYRASLPPSERTRALAEPQPKRQPAPRTPTAVSMSTRSPRGVLPPQSTSPSQPGAPTPPSRLRGEEREREIERLADEWAPEWLKRHYIYVAQGERELLHHQATMRRWEGVEEAYYHQLGQERLQRTRGEAQFRAMVAAAMAGGASQPKTAKPAPSAAPNDQDPPADKLSPAKAQSLARWHALQAFTPSGRGPADIRPWALEEHSERTISVAHSIFKPLARTYLHLLRLYQPAFHHLSRLPAFVLPPSMLEAPGEDDKRLAAATATSTQSSPLVQSLSRFSDKAMSGDGLTLGARALRSLGEVMERIQKRYGSGPSSTSSSSSSSGSGGPSGPTSSGGNGHDGER